MRVLITGVSGFAGRWLARELANDKKILLFGISRTDLTGGARHTVPLPHRMRLITCDLSDPAATLRAIRKIRPDRIHHLAGQASVAYSWKHPVETRRENVAATRNLLSALHRLKLRPAIHVAGSAEVYGRQHRPRIRETDRPSPRNPYARTKLEQEKMIFEYARKEGVPVVVTRAFNHAGPEQKEQFVLSNFARQIARIEKGMALPVLHVGNLSAIRDFTDVRDVARAYQLAIETVKAPTVYNVSTGRARSLASVVRLLTTLSRKKIRVERDSARVRAEDLPRLVGDSSKLSRETGWRPRIELKQTLEDTLRHWRSILKKEET